MYQAADSTLLGCYVEYIVDGGVDERKFESSSEIASLPAATSFHSQRTLLTEEREQWVVKRDSGRDAAGVVQFVFDSQISTLVGSLVAAALIDNSGSCLIIF